MARKIVGRYHDTNVTTKAGGTFMVQANTGKPRTYLWSHRLRIYVWDRGLAHLKISKSIYIFWFRSLQLLIAYIFVSGCGIKQDVLVMLGINLGLAHVLGWNIWIWEF